MWYAWDMARDEVSKYEEEHIGDVVRLEIPLKSVMNLRRVAEELHGLAHQLECLGRFNTEKPSVAMLQVRFMVRDTNHRLDKIRGRGRPKRSRNKF